MWIWSLYRGQHGPNSDASVSCEATFDAPSGLFRQFQGAGLCPFGEGKKGRVRSSPVRHREVMMRTLPTTMLHLLNPFVPLFSKRVWPHVLVLLAGAILAPGKRTVSAALRVMGLGQTEHFQRYHRVLN